MNFPAFFEAVAAGQLVPLGGDSELEAAGLERIHLSAGQTLCAQGDAGDSMFIVRYGRLRCFVSLPGGDERSVGEVARGEIVGELSLLTGAPRSATVRAIRDTELWIVSKALFDHLLETDPRVVLPLVRRVIGRLQGRRRISRDTVSGAVSAVTVAAVEKTVPISDFALRLGDALSRAAPALRLTSAQVDGALWEGAAQTPWHHARNGQIVEWLSRQEESHSFIVYEADPAWSPWTVRCMRQADRVLFVAWADRGPELGEIETALEREGTRAAHASADLVLLHRKRVGLNTGTRRWLEKRHCRTHHHVCLDSTEDFDRLVRFITGRANGLVLGGGGARSFAQIGAIRAIDEAGIPVDVIGGTSMGAFISAQRALGWDWSEIQRYSKDCWARAKVYKDYTLPYMGLTAGLKFKAAIKSVYGSADVEDLWTHFFCISSNLTRAEMMVHRHGLIWRWLAASIAVPGLAPPFFERGDLLTDGGVLNNLPIDVMRSFCGGAVIAVDVSPVQDLKVDVEYHETPTGGRILWSRLNPFLERLEVPTLPEILGRVTSLNSVHAVEGLKRQASLYMHPPVDAYSIFDFDRIEELVDVGYRDAQARLGEWRSGASGQAQPGGDC